MKQIFNIFLCITFISILGIVYLQYKKISFAQNPLSEEMTQKIKNETLEIRKKIYQFYGVDVNFPIKISDKLPNNVYGMATLNENKEIAIYLNKKRYKESSNYMSSVLSHEYAHAMMFYFGDVGKENGGHSKKWQEICYKIGGTTCERFVNRHDILRGKVRF